MTQGRDQEDRALIRAAMAYRSSADHLNSVYMGSMAIAGLYHTLGLKYGGPGFDSALDSATRQQLDRLLEQCGTVIRFMQDHPRQKCPCCGQIIPAAP